MSSPCGRPSIRTDDIVERIIGELMDGKSLVKICDAKDMPNRRTILRWMESDEEFATKCARARAMQADLMDDKIADLIETCTPKSAVADRVKLAAMQWRAAKLMPKKYGDKITQEHTGPDGVPLTPTIVLSGHPESALASEAVGGIPHKRD